MMVFPQPPLSKQHLIWKVIWWKSSYTHFYHKVANWYVFCLQNNFTSQGFFQLYFLHLNLWIFINHFVIWHGIAMQYNHLPLTFNGIPITRSPKSKTWDHQWLQNQLDYPYKYGYMSKSNLGYRSAWFN